MKTRPTVSEIAAMMAKGNIPYGMNREQRREKAQSAIAKAAAKVNARRRRG